MVLRTELQPKQIFSINRSLCPLLGGTDLSEVSSVPLPQPRPVKHASTWATGRKGPEDMRKLCSYDPEAEIGVRAEARGHTQDSSYATRYASRVPAGERCHLQLLAHKTVRQSLGMRLL